MKKKNQFSKKNKQPYSVPKNIEHTQTNRRNQFHYQKKGKRKG